MYVFTAILQFPPDPKQNPLVVPRTRANPKPAPAKRCFVWYLVLRRRGKNTVRKAIRLVLDEIRGKGSSVTRFYGSICCLLQIAAISGCSETASKQVDQQPSKSAKTTPIAAKTPGRRRDSSDGRPIARAEEALERKIEEVLRPEKLERKSVEVLRPDVNATCERSKPSILGPSEARRLRFVGVTFDGKGGLVVWARNLGNLHSRKLQADGTPIGEARTIEVPKALKMIYLGRVGSRYLVVTHDLCVDQRYMNKCYYLRALNEEGGAGGPAFEQKTGEWAESFIEPTEDGIVVLRGHVYRPPVFERYRIQTDGSIEREVVNDELVSGKRDKGGAFPEARALAVGHGRAAALLERTDSSLRHRYYLAFADGKLSRLQHAFPEETEIRGFSFLDRERLRLVYSGRDNRKRRILEINRDGSLESKPLELTPDMSMPPPDTLKARLTREPATDPHKSNLYRNRFEWYDSAGRLTGKSIDLGSSPAGNLSGEGIRYIYVSVTRLFRPQKVLYELITCKPVGL